MCWNKMMALHTHVIIFLLYVEMCWNEMMVLHMIHFGTKNKARGHRGRAINSRQHIHTCSQYIHIPLLNNHSSKSRLTWDLHPLRDTHNIQDHIQLTYRESWWRGGEKGQDIGLGECKQYPVLFHWHFFLSCEIILRVRWKERRGNLEKKRKRKNEIKKGMMEIAKNSKNKTKERKRKDEEKISSG